jgi:hypothetical protein
MFVLFVHNVSIVVILFSIAVVQSISSRYATQAPSLRGDPLVRYESHLYISLAPIHRNHQGSMSGGETGT